MENTDPIALFEELFVKAQATEAADATACALATADAAGRPSVRIVLLKGAGPDGFAFYTNYGSRKARELEANPRAALCFHWPRLRLQVRIEGDVARVSLEESAAYFASRPRGHQLGAWASSQSAPLASREALVERFREAEARYAGGAVPCPPLWGGYRLRPEHIEFWYGQDDRLHDRLLYTRSAAGWSVERLNP